MPLADFVMSFAGRPLSWDGREREDLWRVIEERVGAAYGADTARRAVAELRADPLVPTSNHFGIDTFADSVQGTLLHALRPLPDGRPRTTAVVLACSSVSLDNLTYPMGLMLYDAGDDPSWRGPRRVAIFPGQYRRWTVGAAPPFTAEMVSRARERVTGLLRERQIGLKVANAALALLEEDVAREDVLSLPNYGRQAAAVNAAWWSRVVPRGFPELVQVDLEGVCADLAVRDLGTPDSLLSLLLFQQAVRDRLLTALDGQPACWRLADLSRRLRVDGGAQSREGTLFFWAMRPDGRRVPLTLAGADGRRPVLAGRDERGRDWRYPFTPDALREGLLERRLVPSLLSCFTVLAFARGVLCSGGYYQADYLPVMQRAVVQAVAVVDPGWADRVGGVPADIQLAGLQFAVHVSAAGAYTPAGPLELAATGGLTADDMRRIGTMTVADAHRTALLEVLPHLVPERDLPSDWRERAAVLLARHGDRPLRRDSRTGDVSQTS